MNEALLFVFVCIYCPQEVLDMLIDLPYIRERAVEYALRWALSRNPLFIDFTRAQTCQIHIECLSKRMRSGLDQLLEFVLCDRHRIFLFSRVRNKPCASR